MIGALPMGAKIEPQEPILVAADATSFVAHCDYCMYERNAPDGAGARAEATTT